MRKVTSRGTSSSLLLVITGTFYSFVGAQDQSTLTGQFRAHKNFQSRFLPDRKSVV